MKQEIIIYCCLNCTNTIKTTKREITNCRECGMEMIGSQNAKYITVNFREKEV